MAKKGGVQQLQADISTDEDFEKFLDRPGLLVLDVYSEWCGPCLGMVGGLKKIKLELGGDNLHLAICKSDTISYLKRFNKKSEPSWLFVTNGKAVNLMFGTNVPKLMKMITDELHLLTSKQPRTYYDITELQPEEVQRKKVKDAAIEKALSIEKAEETRKKIDYLTYVTDNIIENLPDIGVTIFGPQVNRDMFKKIMEPADAMKIQCKDRKVAAVTRNNFEVGCFNCRNPLPDDVLDILEDKELLICFWKVPDEGIKSVPDYLMAYVDNLTKQRVDPNELLLTDEPVLLPPILSPLDVQVEVPLEDWEELPESSDESAAAAQEQTDLLEELVGEDEENEMAEMGMPDVGLDMGLDMGLDIGSVEEKVSEVELVKPEKRRVKLKTVTVPPVWVPNNQRSHAALVYTFFRGQTTPFLPPDPVPEPPHVIMAFDAYKKRELIDLLKRYKEDLPAYGFFTTDDPQTAKYITNSVHKYNRMPHEASDKIIFKVNKKTSNTMLSLLGHGPSYVSDNTVTGKEDALKLFPSTYKTYEQEIQEQNEAEQLSKEKRKTDAKKSAAEAAGAPGYLVEEFDDYEGTDLKASPTVVSDTLEQGASPAAPAAAEEATPASEAAAPESAEAARASVAPAAEEAAPSPATEAAPEAASEAATEAAPEASAEAATEVAADPTPPAAEGEE